MPPLRWFSTRWFSTTVVALLVALAAGGGARAQAGGNAYTVTGVDVDVNAADAVQARQQGLAEARRKAAKMLVERLVTPEERARVSTPDDAQPRRHGARHRVRARTFGAQSLHRHLERRLFARAR